MKKISVIVPVYNMENYLEKCLTSLVQQTLKEIEIIVINDGSTDNSLEIIKRFEKQYHDKIILINNKNNGIGKTRNIGIEKATGEYISFIDSDDYVDINMLEHCYEYAKKHDLDIVVCNYIQVFESDGNQKKYSIEPFGITNIEENKELLFKINSSPWNKIFRKTLFNDKKMRFPETLKYEDFALIPILFGEAKKIGHLDEYLNYYLIRSRGETGTMDKKVFDILKILDIVNCYYKNRLKDELEYLNIEKIFTYTISQRKQKDSKLRNKFINEAFTYLNNNFPSWRKNKYYCKRDLKKRLIETNKYLTQFYCAVYNYLFVK